MYGYKLKPDIAKIVIGLEDQGCEHQSILDFIKDEKGGEQLFEVASYLIQQALESKQRHLKYKPILN